MNINDIMKDLREGLEFANTHTLSSINLEVIVIQEAQFRINMLFATIDESMRNACEDTALVSLDEMVDASVINSYAKAFGNTYVIYPKNTQKFANYCEHGGSASHFHLTFPKTYDNILA